MEQVIWQKHDEEHEDSKFILNPGNFYGIPKLLENAYNKNCIEVSKLFTGFQTVAKIT